MASSKHNTLNKQIIHSSNVYKLYLKMWQAIICVLSKELGIFGTAVSHTARSKDIAMTDTCELGDDILMMYIILPGGGG